MKKGFTLVELIIAISLFSVLLSGVFLSLGTSIRSWQKLTDQAGRQQVQQFALDRIIEDVRRASQVLSLSNTQELQLAVGSDQIKYSLRDQKVRRQKNAYASYLTDKNEVKALSFAYPNSKLVEIRLGQYQTKAVLRN